MSRFLPERRQFLQQGSAAALGAGMILPHAASALGARDGRLDTLRIGLIGCGGRGTGAASEALSTAGEVRLVGMADAFSDRLEGALGQLEKGHGAKVDVPESRRFVGFDAYRQLLALDLDVVVIATPPGFRPIHFEHAIERGCHVFMEKPVAVDGPGVRKVLAAAQRAKEKNLKVGVGLQRHHDRRYQETIQRLQAGAIGAIRLLRVYWNSSGVWVRPRQPGQTEMEYQMRNWYYFNWLCGDHITEQHIHNLDVGNWVMNGYPARAQGQGGRQVRTGIDHGEIYDHHMVEYTYADGTTMLSQCRHIRDTWTQVNEFASGADGHCNIGSGQIERGDGEKWRFREERGDAYQVEHDVLFAAIRNDQPHNEAENGAKSTLTSILGRMATYSGQVVTWEQALNSEIALVPARYAFDADPPTLPGADGRYAVPMPGSTQPF